MTTLLSASHLLLWIAVIVQGLLIFALSRQIGVLHTRIAPAGALMTRSGLAVDDPVPELNLKDIYQRDWSIGQADESGHLILFVAPDCPICKALVPAALSLARYEGIRLTFASDGENLEAHKAYTKKMHIEAVPLFGLCGPRYTLRSRQTAIRGAD